MHLQDLSPRWYFMRRDEVTGQWGQTETQEQQRLWCSRVQRLQSKGWTSKEDPGRMANEAAGKPGS